MFPKFLQGVVGVPGFLNDFNVRFVFQKPPHAVPDKRVPVDNQATNFRSAKGAANELILHNHSWGPEKIHKRGRGQAGNRPNPNKSDASGYFTSPKRSKSPVTHKIFRL